MPNAPHAAEKHGVPVGEPPRDLEGHRGWQRMGEHEQDKHDKTQVLGENRIGGASSGAELCLVVVVVQNSVVQNSCGLWYSPLPPQKWIEDAIIGHDAAGPGSRPPSFGCAMSAMQRSM